MKDADRSLANVMLALDRCEHGRHMGDSCTECIGGKSIGNKFLEAGQRLGTDLYGRAIVFPGDPRVMGLVDYWCPDSRGSARPNPA